MGFLGSIGKAIKKAVGSVVKGVGDLAEGAVAVGGKIVQKVAPVAVVAAGTYFGGPLGGAAAGALYGGVTEGGGLSDIVEGGVIGYFGSTAAGYTSIFGDEGGGDSVFGDVLSNALPIAGFVGSYFLKEGSTDEYEWREGDINGVGAVDPAMAGRPGYDSQGRSLGLEAKTPEEYGLLLAHNWAYDAGEIAEEGNEIFDFGMSVGTMIGDLLGSGSGGDGDSYRTAEGKPTNDKQEVVESVLKVFTPDQYEDTTPAIRSLHAINTEDVAWAKELQTATVDTPEYTAATNRSAWEASGMSLAKIF